MTGQEWGYSVIAWLVLVGLASWLGPKVTAWLDARRPEMVERDRWLCVGDPAMHARRRMLYLAERGYTTDFGPIEAGGYSVRYVDAAGEVRTERYFPAATS